MGVAALLHSNILGDMLGGSMPDNVRQLQERRQYLASLQLMFTVALALGMLLAFQFTKRISEAKPLHAEFAQTSAELLALEAERTALREELAFIQSDAYIEFWARGEAKMLRPGETLVFTLGAAPNSDAPAATDTNPSPRSSYTETNIATYNTSANWRLWWQLFFDGPVPGNN